LLITRVKHFQRFRLHVTKGQFESDPVRQALEKSPVCHPMPTPPQITNDMEDRI
jgi:hypothetical protein